MDLSLSLAGGHKIAVEPHSAPVDSSLPADELLSLLYMPLPPGPEPQLPAPGLSADWSATVAPPPDLDVTGAQVDPVQEPAVDPQQWLNMMLGQQAIQLQARNDAGRAESGLPGGRSLQRMVPASHNPLPAFGSSTVAQQSLPEEPGQRLLLMPDRRDPVAPVQPAAAVAATVAQSLPAALSAPADGAQVPAPPTLPPGSDAAPDPVLERGLKLAAPQARWGEQMLHALRETVEVQVQQRFQQATIRLDPPELGSLEILISHESGRLSVHISAAQSDVARLLASTSERLRQELVEQNTLQVHVQVSSDSRGHSSREQGRPAREPDIAGASVDDQGDAASPAQPDSGVLVTV